jgi:hypothetical protein
MQNLLQRSGDVARTVWAFLKGVWTQAWLLLVGIRVLLADIAQTRRRREQQA